MVGYELGTAKTFDSAESKFEMFSGSLPAIARSGEIQSVAYYRAEDELIIVAQDTDLENDRHFYYSPNKGRTWKEFASRVTQEPSTTFETHDGTLLLAGSEIFRYTGNGQLSADHSPSDHDDVYADGITQTTDGDLYLAEYGSSGSADLIKSTDDGQTWTQIADLTTYDSNIDHLHGIASQGSDRLFVVTGDTVHQILESNDEFGSNINEWVWNTPAGTDDISYTGISCENHHLILGADQIPSHITRLWVGESYGDIPTNPSLGNGTVPVSMFHVLVPNKLSDNTTNVSSRYNHPNGRPFVHSIKSDGVMLYGMTIRSSILCVSTTGGASWKFIELPIDGQNWGVAVGRDSIYIGGHGEDGAEVIRIPKMALWNHPEPERQHYQLLYNEDIGDSASGGNATPVAKGFPHHLWSSMRIGIDTDGSLTLNLIEDKDTGIAGMGSGTHADRFSQDFASEYLAVEYDISHNWGLNFGLFETNTSAVANTSMFVQCSR